MKRNSMKNNLDEMQEQKLLKIEHNGCWFAFWALFLSIIVQNFVVGNEFRYVIGEWIIFMCLSIYMGVACMKNGIWDRRLKADPITNLVISIIAGVVMAVNMFFQAYNNSGKPVGSICAGIFTGGFIFIVCFLALTFCAVMYQKRVDKMEAEVEEE